MTKHEHMITDPLAIESILDKALVLRLGLCGNGAPYIVPVCFGFAGGKLFVHSGQTGKKMELMQANPQVCFEVDVDVGLLKPANQDNACAFGVRYSSVVGYGQARILKERQEKIHGLEVIVAHYSDKQFSLPDKAVDKTAVVEIVVDSMTGKARGYD